jgi:hypothetical protein
MLPPVALVTTNVSEEVTPSIIMVRISELRALAVTSNRRMLRRNSM